MTLDQKRVAEIWVQATEKRGTGYLLYKACLLTAYHVIKNCGSKGIEFRLLGDYQTKPNTWLRANPIWTSQKFDLALLQFFEQDAKNISFPKIEKLDLDHRIDCKFCGFPFFGKEHDSHKPIYQPHTKEGWFPPHSLDATKTAGKLNIEIDGSTPNNMKAWQGISGSAVFTKEGCLAGVVIQGPESLNGGSLEAVALETVIADDPTFSEVIDSKFSQTLDVFDPSRQKFIEKMDLIMTRLIGRRLQRQSEKNDDKEESLKSRLASTTEKTVGRLSNEEQLLELLKNIENSSGVLFWDAWITLIGSKPTAYQSIRLIDSVEVVFATLFLEERKELSLPRFLAIIYQLLLKDGFKEHIQTLIELAKNVCDLDLTQESVQIKNVQELKQSCSGKATLLIKLTNTNRPNDPFESYALKIWLIRDRIAYQKRFKSADKQSLGLDSYSDRIQLEKSDSSVLVASKDKDNRAQLLKDFLAKTITNLWRNKSLQLKKIKPEIIFCVPIQLLKIDFQNIVFLGHKTLGKELPVSINCSERYDAKLEDYIDDWIERWEALENCSDLGCFPHLEIYRENSEDHLRSRKEFYDFLLKRAKEKGLCVSGMVFYEPYAGFSPKVFEMFFAMGLPIIFWPNNTLHENHIQELKTSLKMKPHNILTSIKDYRMDKTPNSGCISVLLDSPYLCPPDSKIDY